MEPDRLAGRVRLNLDGPLIGIPVASVSGLSTRLGGSCAIASPRPVAALSEVYCKWITFLSLGTGRSG